MHLVVIRHGSMQVCAYTILSSAGRERQCGFWTPDSVSFPRGKQPTVPAVSSDERWRLEWAITLINHNFCAYGELVATGGQVEFVFSSFLFACLRWVCVYVCACATLKLMSGLW